MKRKNAVRSTAYAALFTALATVFVLLGSVFDLLDLVFVAAASLTVHISLRELRKKYVFMIYAASAILALLLMPLSTASLYFTAFFGYYPLLRVILKNVIKNKVFYYGVLYLIYNLAMGAIFFLFRELFGFQNDPVWLIILFVLVTNLYLFAFDRMTSLFYILFDYRLKKARQKRIFNKQLPKEIPNEYQKRDI